MRRSFLIVAWAFAMGGLTATGTAQVVVWHDDFQSAPLGRYPPGPIPMVSLPGNPREIISNNFPLGANAQNLACLFDSSPGTILNFEFWTDSLPATGNTNPQLSAYNLEFDVAVQGVSLNSLGGLFGYVAPAIYVFGDNGDGLQSNVPASFFPAAGTGYEHVSMNLGSFGTAPGMALLNPTDGSFSFAIGFYITGQTYTGTEEIDLGDVQIVAVPEPGACALFGLGLAGLTVFCRRRLASCQ